MTTDSMTDFFAALGFEEVEIEDNLTVLGIDADSDGNYILLTDEEGALPATLRQRIVLAYYTADGAYQWSVGFKNAFLFKDTWSSGDDLTAKLAVLQQYRADRAD